MAPAKSCFLRALKIVVLVVVSVVIVRTLRGRRRPPVTGEASWPPLHATVPPEPEPAPAPAPAGGWVEPVEGVCPATHPVKGNANSGIYHVPGGMFYDRTVPERCYASTDDAEADGFRPAKR